MSWMRWRACDIIMTLSSRVTSSTQAMAGSHQKARARLVARVRIAPGPFIEGMLVELHHLVERGAEEVAVELAARVLAMEAQAEMIHMAEELRAQLQHHALAHPGEHPEADVPHDHAQEKTVATT